MKHKTIVWSFIIFYSLFALYKYIFYRAELYEYLFFDVFLLIILFNIRKFNISQSTLFLIGLVPFLHTLGMFQVTEKLIVYSIVFGGNYDFVTHFAGFIIVTLIPLQILDRYNPSKTTYFILFFALIGLGACFELCEFTGHYVFGFGEGAFFFGDGDNSENFGPWGDSMTDTIANMLGIAFAYLAFFLQFLLKNLSFKKK